MAKHKRRRKRKQDVDLAIMAGDALETLTQIKALVETAAGITTSLQALLGSYQAMQGDGSWDLLLSALSDQGSPTESSDELSSSESPRI